MPKAARPSGCMDSSNHAIGGASGSITMVVIFVVCLCCVLQSYLSYVKKVPEHNIKVCILPYYKVDRHFFWSNHMCTMPLGPVRIHSPHGASSLPPIPSQLKPSPYDGLHQGVQLQKDVWQLWQASSVPHHTLVCRCVSQSQSWGTSYLWLAVIPYCLEAQLAWRRLV